VATAGCPNTSDAGAPTSWRPSGRPLALNFPLMLPDFERADRIGEFWSYPQSRATELLINCEEDRTLRAVFVGILREAD